MSDAFHTYPEIAFIDATWKLYNALRRFKWVERNWCLLTTEDATHEVDDEDIQCNWTKVRVVMIDKDIGERDILNAAFPQSEVCTCSFHALRTFHHEITRVMPGCFPQVDCI